MSKTKGTYEEHWATKTVNDYIGCTNGCLYCYAKKGFLRRKLIKSDLEFMTPKQSKTSIKRFQKISKGINPFKKYEGRVMYPSTHDINDATFHIARRTLIALAEVGNKILIVSKGDYNLLMYLSVALEKWKEQIEFRITITTFDDEVRKIYEPHAPSVADRIAVLRQLHFNGWQTSVSIEPYLDTSLMEIVLNVKDYVTTYIFIGVMNPKNLFPDLEYLYTKEVIYDYWKQLSGTLEPEDYAKIKFKDTTELLLRQAIIDPLVIKDGKNDE